ncbi:hypothetical protein BDV26DRAFT_278613 [Aspergillus bertholletiae]|uniref:F-box domain-containing protein n=1 Tax=Aspergillus bertholletiae TaxID=1226010 RepID=A0A5N7BJC3_9EURO|nr:hypothetical protein BDV26DRAFT_278613 [Aspergillus bertholletiae]
MLSFFAEKIRSFLRLPREKPRSTPPLLDLPVEIISEIFPLLPLPSRVCLALSCKALYGLFSSSLQDERLGWPSLAACKTFNMTKLLLQLQDDCWLYCRACLKIQPRAMFWPRAALVPPGLRECIYTARVIDLCPCLSLTYFDRIRLERWLYTGLTDTLSPRIRKAFQLSVASVEPSLIHRCSWPDIPGVSVDLLITVMFNQNQQLEAQTMYDVRMSDYNPIPWCRVPHFLGEESYPHRLYLCPHVDLLPFICGTHFWPRTYCYTCETSASVASCGKRDWGNFYHVWTKGRSLN